MIEQEITLSEILLAREERVAIQNALLSEYHAPVISFTMNIAGPVKVTAASHRAFLWGMEQLRLGFIQNRLNMKKEFSRSLPTGDEGYFAIDASAEKVKALCLELEESNAMGRLFDMDVIGLDGKKLDRSSERPCLICGKPGRDCASRRLHTVAELRQRTDELLTCGLLSLDRVRISDLATAALLEEVSVTPKPGLVDRSNSGAHRDMDLSTFRVSAESLRGFWGLCFYKGERDVRIKPVPAPQTFRDLRSLGMTAEDFMLEATGGINTHKGAIFTLGVLCGAIGRLWSAEEGFAGTEAILNEASAMTREILEKELPNAHWNTAGEELYRKYGTRGIRGQVADGLPAVREISLPVFSRLLRDGLDRNHAAAVTLLYLIANVEDTNVLHRGGPDGADWARKAAAALLSEQEIPGLEAIAELDRQFIDRNLSPGGCADLLAVTLFLERIGAKHADFPRP